MPESTEEIEEFARVQSRLPELFREVFLEPACTAYGGDS